MLHEQNFTLFVGSKVDSKVDRVYDRVYSSTLLSTLVGSYYTCCDVIIFVNSEKAEITVIENSTVF